MTIFDFMPLGGDPSEEERKKIEQENFEQKMIEARKQRERILNRFANYGRV
jgi:hypothetical protein